MSETPQTVPTAQTDNQPKEQGGQDPLELLISEFGQEAGKRVGDAIAEEIHSDPETRQAAATGAGIGVGVVVGIGVLALLME